MLLNTLLNFSNLNSFSFLSLEQSQGDASAIDQEVPVVVVMKKTTSQREDLEIFREKERERRTSKKVKSFVIGREVGEGERRREIVVSPGRSKEKIAVCSSSSRRISGPPGLDDDAFCKRRKSWA